MRDVSVQIALGHGSVNLHVFANIIQTCVINLLHRAFRVWNLGRIMSKILNWYCTSLIVALSLSLVNYLR